MRESAAAKVDTVAPAVSIDTPVDGAVLQRDEVATASYACTDESGGSGVQSCAGTVAHGAAIDTSAVGEHSFTVTATDGVGFKISAKLMTLARLYKP